MKIILICHEGAVLDQEGLVKWLASFSNVVGVVVLQETRQRVWRRIKREIERVGIIAFLDVLAFRIYYKLFLFRHDRLWETQKLKQLSQQFADIDTKGIPVLYTPSPNTTEAEQFIRKLSPDMMLARCKTLLKEDIFSIPTRGTFVMHPGICPEYRNAHGCFWALANGDLEKVGMSLLRIDNGVDTGPIYGYYGYAYDEKKESHIVIQHRVVHENLDTIRDKLIEIYSGRAVPLEVSGRPSATWGQPWLTRYLRWKYYARRRNG
jgi:hypothetical protein